MLDKKFQQYREDIVRLISLSKSAKTKKEKNKYKEKIIEIIETSEVEYRKYSYFIGNKLSDNMQLYCGDSISNYEDYSNLSENILFELIENELVVKNVGYKKLYMDNEEKIIYIKDVLDSISRITCDLDHIDRLYTLLNCLSHDIHKKQSIYYYEQYYESMKALEIYLIDRKNSLEDLLSVLEIGIKGEEYVNTSLKLYEDEIINLTNIRLEIDGNSIENDNILISKHGIFIIEVKNLGTKGGYSIEIERDGRWLKCYNNGRKEVIDFNPTVQNDRHVILLQKLINSKLGRTMYDDNYIKVNGIVVLANNEINIYNHSDQDVYRSSEIYRQISKRDIYLSGQEMLQIKNIITQRNLPPKKYPIIDLKLELSENIKLFNKIIDKFEPINQISKNIENTLKEYIRLQDIVYNKSDELNIKVEKRITDDMGHFDYFEDRALIPINCWTYFDPKSIHNIEELLNEKII